MLDTILNIIKPSQETWTVYILNLRKKKRWVKNKCMEKKKYKPTKIRTKNRKLHYCKELSNNHNDRSPGVGVILNIPKFWIRP